MHPPLNQFWQIRHKALLVLRVQWWPVIKCIFIYGITHSDHFFRCKIAPAGLIIRSLGLLYNFYSRTKISMTDHWYNQYPALGLLQCSKWMAQSLEWSTEWVQAPYLAGGQGGKLLSNKFSKKSYFKKIKSALIFIKSALIKDSTL